jgi:hypothetical protein
VVEFTTEQIATWLEEANEFRRARWVHWPDAARLAAELSAFDFSKDGRYFAQHEVRRQVKLFTGKLRRLAAAWDDPTMSREVRLLLTAAIAGAFYPIPLDFAGLVDAVDKRDKSAIKKAFFELLAIINSEFRALDENPGRFSGALHKAAEDAEQQLANPYGLTYASFLRFIYTKVFRMLEHHTGSKVSTRPTGPDARFIRDVLEYAGVAWRPKTWRAAVQRPFSTTQQDRGGRSRSRTVPFCRKKNLQKG